MAGGTCTGEACENILSDMTAIAFQRIMKLPQRPTGPALMVESGLGLRSVAPVAPLVGVVAAFARLMSLFDSNELCRCILAFLMTPNAGLACVALRAFQTKAVDMFVMVERH